MPPPYPYRGHLKAEIVARVAQGERLVGICADAHMPTPECVRVWRRADPAFAAALAEARPRGAWRRELMFDEAVAAAFLARVAAGEKINDLLARPGMPSRRAYTYWRRTQVGFQAALWRLRQGRYARHSSTGHSRWRAWDPAIADRITVAVGRGAVLRRLLASDPALPCLAVAERWRREQPEWNRALRFAMKVGRAARGAQVSDEGRCTPQLMEEITGRIVEGGSLRSIAADPAMPCARTLYAWTRRRPDFEARVLQACDWREEWFADRMLDISDRNGPLGLAATKRETLALRRQLWRLRKRPGWKKRRSAREPDQAPDSMEQ